VYLDRSPPHGGLMSIVTCVCARNSVFMCVCVYQFACVDEEEDDHHYHHNDDGSVPSRA
jgi:hypothetical protein